MIIETGNEVRRRKNYLNSCLLRQQMHALFGHDLHHSAVASKRSSLMCLTCHRYALLD